MSDNSDLNTGLTGNMQDFFSDDGGDDKNTPTMGRVAFFVLDVIVYGLAVYSGYHGIHATAKYRAGGGLGNAAGIVGIVIIELTLLAIYEAFKARLITGKGQKFIAGITFAIGTILACLGIVGDSQMQAGLTITPWLNTYMIWGLPLAPVVMALGAAGVVVAHPKLQRQIKAALKRDEFAEKKHEAQMKAEDARLQVAKTTANVQLNTLQMAATLVNQAYRTPQVQAHIANMAINSLPDIMRAVGVNIPYGTIIEGIAVDQSAAPAPQDDQPPAADPPTDQPGIIDNIRKRLGRKSAAEPSQPSQPTEPPAAPPSDDAPRHALDDLTPTELRQLMADLAALRQAAATPSGAGRNNGAHPNA